MHLLAHLVNVSHQLIDLGPGVLVQPFHTQQLNNGHLEKPDLYVAERAELTARLQF